MTHHSDLKLELKPNVVLKFLRDNIQYFSEEDLDDLEMILFSEISERENDDSDGTDDNEDTDC